MTIVIADIRDQTCPVLWADTCTHSCDLTFQATKIRKINASILFGSSGNTNDGIRFGHYLSAYDFEVLLSRPGEAVSFTFADEKDRPSFLACLIYRPEGCAPKIYQIYEDMIPTLMSLPFHAIGSGAAFALGAMQCGATARQALAVAITLDKHSRLPIESLSFDKDDVCRFPYFND